MNDFVPPNHAEPNQPTSASTVKSEKLDVAMDRQLPDVAESAVDTMRTQVVAQTEIACPSATTHLLPAEQTPTVPLSEVLQQITRLADMFDDKIRYDQVKEGIIDKLHAELQQHRSDMLGRILLPVMRDVIHLHRAILTFVDARRAFPEEKRDWNNVLDNVATFGDDIIEILARNGVESFSEEGATFNPRTQKALRTLATQDASADRTIAQRLRPGFRWGQQLIQNEEVIVYKLQPAVTPTSTSEAAPQTH